MADQASSRLPLGQVETHQATGVLGRFGVEIPLLLPMFAGASGIGYLPLLTLPWLIGSLVRDWGYSDSIAGMIVTGEIGLLALTTIIVGSVIHRLPRRALCMAGGCVVLGSNAALLFVPSPTMLIPSLAATAIGCGTCSATSNSLLGSAKEPARLTAHMWALTVPWQAFVWFITPILIEHLKAAGLWWVLAGASALCLPMVLLMPDSNAEARGGLRGIIAQRRGRLGMALPLFLCALAFWFRDSLTWSLGERRGLLLGVTEYHLGLTLTAASLFGLAGPLAANHLGMRLGRTTTVLGGLIFLGVVMQLIACAASPLPYQIGLILWPASSIFAWTYLMEAAAALDPAGRVAAISGGIVFAASACGPLAGGALMQWGDRTALPSVVLMLTAATLLTAYVTARRL